MTSLVWYSDKTDHGQNGPDKTDHVSGQNGPRLRTKQTKFQSKRTRHQDRTDQASGQKGPGFRTERTTFLDKTDPVIGQTGPCKKIHDVLQRSEESSQYPQMTLYLEASIAGSNIP